uniref:SAP domain-containing protein n=1 Tax=Clastoptera arizonana TaxID=38151 RepID=A0A1B6CHT4_9HEMI
MSESKPKKLAELTVVHLRGELEKRNLNKNGVKAELYERLEKALKEEGQDPESYLFELVGKGSSKRSRRGDGDESVEVSEDDKDESNSQEDKEKDNEITDETKTEKVEDYQNPGGEEEEKNNQSITVSESITSQNKEESIVKESLIKENLSNNSQIDKNVILMDQKDDITNKENVKEPHITPKKSNLNEDTLPSSPGLNKLNQDYSKSDTKSTPEKKSPLKTEDGKLKQNDIIIESQKEEKSSVDANNSIDNEDSLNLTIGEDEDNFLGDEEEISQDKDQKGKFFKILLFIKVCSLFTNKR